MARQVPSASLVREMNKWKILKLFSCHSPLINSLYLAFSLRFGLSLIPVPLTYQSIEPLMHQPCNHEPIHQHH